MLFRFDFKGVSVALFTQQRHNQIFAQILNEVVPQDELAKISPFLLELFVLISMKSMN